MIKTKSDLKLYIKQDDSRFDSIPTLFNLICGNIHKYRIRRFVHILRKLEYYRNNRNTGGVRLCMSYIITSITACNGNITSL